ncbi:MAG: N-acetyltransferase [Deltaproteobacteria bacterium]|nr:N-acetyltransferase [Deltaproteobacteria bacterium]
MRQGNAETGKAMETGLKNTMQLTDTNRFIIQHAKVGDVKGILDLVNWLAKQDLMLPRGPQYVYENIRDFVVVIDETESDVSYDGHKRRDRKIIACCSMHVLWEDIAEVRSLAIHPDFQKAGLGKKIVEYMVEDAKCLGIKHLFTFTLAQDFFEALGFEKRNKEELPSKVWGECSRCPKFFKCDEIGMIMEIS